MLKCSLGTTCRSDETKTCEYNRSYKGRCAQARDIKSCNASKSKRCETTVVTDGGGVGATALALAAVGYTPLLAPLEDEIAGVSGTGVDVVRGFG